MLRTMQIFPKAVDKDYERVKPYILMSYIFCFTATLLAPLLYVECVHMYRTAVNGKKRRHQLACKVANFVLILGLILSCITVCTVYYTLRYMVI